MSPGEGPQKTPKTPNDDAGRRRLLTTGGRTSERKEVTVASATGFSVSSVPRPPAALPFPTELGQLPSAFRALAGRPRFVAWRWVFRGGRWTKPPVDVHTGGDAKVDDPATWATFASAVAYARAHGCAGIGIVLVPATRLVGVDLDGCYALDTGELADWASAVVRRLDTYTQVSPSGTGFRLFLHGELPPHLLTDGRQGRRAGPIEVYQGGRYLTVTSVHLAGTPLEVEARQDALSAWCTELFEEGREVVDTGGGRGGQDGQTGALPALPAPVSTRSPGSPGVADDEVVRRCVGAANGAKFVRLFLDGDLGEYGGDDSRADLALCSHLRFYSGDRAQVERLFGQSALGRREKWRGRPDYRAGTITVAMRGATWNRGGRGR